MTAWEFLRDLHKVCHFQSRERGGEATNSELKRWLQSQSLVINGERVAWDEPMDFPMFSVVLFPKNPVTLL